MNKEIKFRIRLQHHINKNIEVDFVTLDQLLNRNGCYWSNIWDIISKDEYSGFKDKNGKEIYEGDIIKFEVNYTFGIKDYISDIIFEKGSFLFCYTDLNCNKDYNPIEPFFKNDYKCEIIGNIYENPELMGEIK